eukprot:TRINITY_DN51184_c0_g1_i1.p1 TRINITY_DN51184_c0_g1~~TRINITY_DN51184_c0_g1_i1.p1  ORF type:complete len:201 (+),score=23.19 TRINITY_DN51184_c0_g1_i1:52-603(+)
MRAFGKCAVEAAAAPTTLLISAARSVVATRPAAGSCCLGAAASEAGVATIGGGFGVALLRRTVPATPASSPLLFRASPSGGSGVRDAGVTFFRPQYRCFSRDPNDGSRSKRPHLEERVKQYQNVDRYEHRDPWAADKAWSSQLERSKRKGKKIVRKLVYPSACPLGRQARADKKRYFEEQAAK